MPARPWDCQLVLTVETPLEHPYRTPPQISYQMMGWKFSVGVSQVGTATTPNGVAGAPSGFQLGIIIGCYLGRAQYDFHFLHQQPVAPASFDLPGRSGYRPKLVTPSAFTGSQLRIDTLENHAPPPRTHTHAHTPTHTFKTARAHPPAPVQLPATRQPEAQRRGACGIEPGLHDPTS